MPSVNLRLTEEELEQLKAWAEDSHRSLQKEVVYRLFRDRSQADKPVMIEVSKNYVDEVKMVDAQPRDIPARTVMPEKEFRGPDPKPVSTKKKR